jgi:hypothetical protein
MDITSAVVLLVFFSGPILLVLWLLALRKIRALRKQIALNSETAEQDIATLREKYAGLISRDDAIAERDRTLRELEGSIAELRDSYAEKKAFHDKLVQQLAIYDDRLSFVELGVYEPHFDFNDSELFKEQIKKVREDQRVLISGKTACICPTDWTVDGSAAKGATMINRQMRLTMRAFNNECEAAIANVRWNNANAMEKRIRNAAKQIDKANESMRLSIAPYYVELKVKELFLTHEYREKLKNEKDERAELARLEREERRLEKEAEAAELEERRFQALLDKARAEAGVDESRIAELEAALAEAHEKTERAKAMAEMTKSGFVYIISNIGSFGEDIVKIGLTRRLDPYDRVKELGDASVPFGFDTHAMIYSDEAPKLEAALHNEFSERRTNMANQRKEFFRVDLEEVEEAVQRLAPEADFLRNREAQEWHETLARRKLRIEVDARNAEASLPASI